MAFIPSLWRTHQKHMHVSTMSVPRCIWLCHSLSVWSLVVLAKGCSVQCAIVVREVLIAEACDATGETTYTRFWDVLSIHHIMYIDVHSFCIHVHSLECAGLLQWQFVSDAEMPKQFFSVQGVGSDGLIKHPISACDSVPGQGFMVITVTICHIKIIKDKPKKRSNCFAAETRLVQIRGVAKSTCGLHFFTAFG